MEKSAAERYQHVDELLTDLRRVRKVLEYAKTPHVRPAAVQPPAPAAGSSPHPVEVVHPVVPARRLSSLPRILVTAAIVATAVILIILINPFKIQVGLKKTVAADRKSVAVLPFKNMSDSREDEFFSDGVTEDIIMQLSSISELKVISRTSVMQYKNTNKNLREIARELNVATILEGSVRRANNQVRIVAQLIDATNDEHLWAQAYDKEMTQIFAIQSDVAQQIASALRAELSPREREQLGKEPTKSIDAYAYYLKGREYYYRYLKRDNENAIALFKEALKLDSDYALAYAGLGDAYAQRWSRFGFPSAWVDSSIAMSSKAISADPNLAEGYKALGLGYYQKGWIRRSIETYRKAIELNPNYWPAVGNIGDCNMILGKVDEALPWYKRALPLNPMFPFAYRNIGDVFASVGDDGKAIALYNKAIALQPDFIHASIKLGRVHLRRGEHRLALDQAQRILSLQPDDVNGLDLAGRAELLLANPAEAEKYFEKGIAVDSAYRLNTQLGYVYWKTGRKDQAIRLFARSLRIDEKQLNEGSEIESPRYDLACINAIQENKAESYKWLQKAIDAGWCDYRYGEIDPLLENLRNDDRFKQMMAGVKARVNEMRKRIEEAEKEEASSRPQN